MMSSDVLDVRVVLLLGLAVSMGCWPEGMSEEEQPRVEVLRLEPETSVPEMSPVRVVLTGAARLAAPRWPVEVTRSDGRRVPVDVRSGADGRELLIAPSPTWPAGERLRVLIQAGLVDALERPVTLPAVPLEFSTTDVMLPAPEAIVRSPVPGRRAPTNLRLVGVALTHPLEGEVHGGTLNTEGHAVSARVLRQDRLALLLELEAGESLRCRPLCPESRYGVVLHADAPVRLADGPRGSIETSTGSDTTPPEIRSAMVHFEGDRVVVEVVATEPILLEGTWSAVGHPMIPLRAPLLGTETVFAEPEDSLAPDTVYRLEAWGVDLSGNRLPPLVLETRTLPRVDVRITEVVTTPLHDWNDSDGRGVPFDPYPGAGTVSIADEWVELVNVSEVPLDLVTADLRLWTVDGTPQITDLFGAPGLYFGDGGDLARWWPGEALVVRPRGSMSQRNLSVELWSGTRMLDRILLSDLPEADHRGGGPPAVPYESLARDASGRVRWCVPTPGNPLPADDCLP